VVGEAWTRVIGARSELCAPTPPAGAGAAVVVFALSDTAVERASWAEETDAAANNAESTQKSCFVEVSI
jgi:hypothetical protein